MTRDPEGTPVDPDAAGGGSPGPGDERYGTVTAAEAREREHASDVDRAAQIVADMADATLLRGVAAVVVGFVVLTLGSVLAGRGIVAAVGPDPDGPVTASFLAWSLGSRALVAILAGYLTARAAPRRPFAHGAALAGLVAFMAGAALFGLRAAGAPQDPVWYPVAMLFVGPLGVLAGAALRVRSSAATVFVAVAASSLAGCAGSSPERADEASRPDPPVAEEPSVADRTTRQPTDMNLLTDYPALPTPATVTVVVEIPAGTDQKWEVTKNGDGLEWEIEDGAPRLIRYLAYPANYGMIPGTLLPTPVGGDGDPLDVVLLGPALGRGTVTEARPVGVLRLLDGGEQDDKIVAVPTTGTFSEVEDLDELRRRYPGALSIVETWFLNYKGPGEMVGDGVAGGAEALAIVREAKDAFDAWSACGDMGDGQGHGPDAFSDEWWSACRRKIEAARPPG